MFKVTSTEWTVDDMVAANTILGNKAVLNLNMMEELDYSNACKDILGRITMTTMESKALALSAASGDRVRIFFHVMLIAQRSADIEGLCGDVDYDDEDIVLGGMNNNIYDTSAGLAQFSDEHGVNGNLVEGDKKLTCPILNGMDVQDEVSNHATGLEEFHSCMVFVHDSELELNHIFAKVFDETVPGVLY